MAHDTEEPIVVRDPAEFAREEAVQTLQWAQDLRERLEAQAQHLAGLLVKQGAQNQKVNNNHEFAARLNVQELAGIGEPFRARVEEIIREQLGDGVDLLVKLFDTRGPYAGYIEGVDITVWATPKKS
jgi:hypothetical protein